MKESEMSANLDKEVLQFLWDKWKHHDDLMYRRETIFLTTQTLFYGMIIFLFQSDICLPLKLVASIILLVIINFVGLGVLKMIEIDRKCRNTFNQKIVEILRQTSLLEKSPTNWKNDKWDATLDDHPINLWHTPKDGRASRIIETIIKVLIVFNFILAILLAIFLKSLLMILLVILLIILLVILFVD